MANCRPQKTYSPRDFSAPRGGARGYLERIGSLAASRNPGPTLVPGDLMVHRIPLAAPLPPAQLQGPLLGENPPDRGQTFQWPHPDV